VASPCCPREAGSQKPNVMRNYRNRHLLIADAALIAVLPLIAYLVRFESLDWGPEHTRTAIIFSVVSIAVALAVFSAFGLYRRLWQYASIAELEALLGATFTAAAAIAFIGAALLPLLGVVPVRVPLSVLFINAILLIAGVSALRLLIRIGVIPFSFERRKLPRGEAVLIAGAGSGGQVFLRELRMNPRLGMSPVGFVDDDEDKQGHWMANLPVLGRIADIPSIVAARQVSAVVIAMPSAPGTVVRQIVRAAQEAGVDVRTVPNLSEIISGRLQVAAIRDVQIEDLLRREPVQTNFDQVRSLCGGKAVLITGAGGSIGGELCRQIASLGPRCLILLGHGENSIFKIHSELEATYPDLMTHPVIADVRDEARISSIFAEYQPDVVFHAAAHKHVPLMEENVVEAITNNVLGTRNVAMAAVKHGTENFVLVSTDKAVRPTNVMGATKRVAEHIVHEIAVRTGRPYVAVRFGNVLGSRGSVVPTFLHQIRSGGPVKVTHPEMRRYFMTIPEAVQLVLQSAALGKGSELFMLDMGEPVRIVDLARDMIRLCGLEEGVDIEIQFTGARAGEKLYEEMFWSDESAIATEHPKILRARSNGHGEAIAVAINSLIVAAQENATAATLRSLLRRVVPEFEGAFIGLPRQTSDGAEGPGSARPDPRIAGSKLSSVRTGTV
jgi:FlaA1/EpsC-like NDP-sugar epimerase